MRKILKTVVNHVGEDILLAAIFTLVGYFLLDEKLTIGEVIIAFVLFFTVDILFGAVIRLVKRLPKFFKESE